MVPGSSARRPAAGLGLVLGVALLAAVSAVESPPPAAAAAATSDYLANCTITLQSSPVAVANGTYPAAVRITSIRAGTGVTATAAVSGDPYSLTCGSQTVAGSAWLPIVAQGDTPIANLYAGYSVAYAPALEFRVAPSYLEGIDVSHWQGSIDWPTVASKGMKAFAFMKATEGTTFVDSNYATNHAAARAAGLRTGAYHFGQPAASTADAVAEADWFVKNMKLTSGDLFPALDLEVRNGLTTSQLVDWTKAFMNELYVKTGVKGAIYTSPSFWSSYLGNTRWFADNGYTVLWVAHWFVAAPTVPASNWGGRGWTFWQYSNCGKVPGIGGGANCVDLDRFNGTDLTRVTYAPDFSLAVTSATGQVATTSGGTTSLATSAASATVPQGGTASYAVSITRSYFTLPIDAGVTGLPAGAVASWTADPATGNLTSLSIATSQGGTVTPPGSYPLTITGSATLDNGIAGGSLVQRTTAATLVVTAPDFSLAVRSGSSTSASTKQGGSVSFGVSLTRSFVDSAVSLSIDGLPAGTAATFTPNPIAAGATTGTLSIITTRTGVAPTGAFPTGGATAGPTPVGSYRLTITATATAPAAAGGSEISHTAAVTLNVTDGLPPLVVAPASRIYASTAGGSSVGVRTGWGASDPSGIRSYALQRQVDGGSWKSVSLSSTTSTSIVQSLAYGHRYRYRVHATDRAGNTSSWVYGPTIKAILTQQTSTAIKYSWGWHTVTSTSFLGGTERYTTSSGASATYTVSSTSFAWVGYKGPTRGYADVYVDGVKVATVNLRASTYKARRIVWSINFGSYHQHTIRIVNRATSGHPRIDLDAVVRLVNL